MLSELPNGTLDQLLAHPRATPEYLSDLCVHALAVPPRDPREWFRRAIEEGVELPLSARAAAPIDQGARMAVQARAEMVARLAHEFALLPAQEQAEWRAKVQGANVTGALKARVTREEIDAEAMKLRTLSQGRRKATKR